MDMVASIYSAPVRVEHRRRRVIGANFPKVSADPLYFVKEGNVTFTAEQARLVTERCVHPIQQEIRPLDAEPARKHIQVLAAMMATPGAWLPRVQIWFGRLDGRLYVLDGNHRMCGQAESGAAVEWSVQIIDCADLNEFRRLFHKFNTNSRGRTEHQILNAVDFAEQIGVSKQTAKAVYAAMPFISSGFKTSRTAIETLKNRVIDTRLATASDFVEEAKMWEACLKLGYGKFKSKLLNAGVTAVALVTLKSQPERAMEFWSGVAANNGLKKGDPRHTLYSDLLTRHLNQGLQHQTIAAPASAWNAWMAGRKIGHIKVVDTDVVNIAGTPYA